jgi:hypothetical protein
MGRGEERTVKSGDIFLLQPLDRSIAVASDHYARPPKLRPRSTNLPRNSDPRDRPARHRALRARAWGPDARRRHSQDDVVAGLSNAPHRPRRHSRRSLGRCRGLRLRDDPGSRHLRGAASLPCWDRLRPRERSGCHRPRRPHGCETRQGPLRAWPRGRRASPAAGAHAGSKIISVRPASTDATAGLLHLQVQHFLVAVLEGNGHGRRHQLSEKGRIVKIARLNIRRRRNQILAG